MKTVRTGMSAFILLAVITVMIGGSSVRADLNPDDPPTVEIYNFDGEIVTEMTIFANEQFTLVGMATGNQPLLRYWKLDGTDISVSSVLYYTISVPGVYTLTLLVTDVNGLEGSSSVAVTVLPSTTEGSICGVITDGFSEPFAGITVKLIDGSNNQVGDPVVSDASGAYEFSDLPLEPYSVMIVTPFGYIASPSETQVDITPATPCSEVNFTLTAYAVANECRSIGYWKHQFDVYLTGRGNAQETETDLLQFLGLVYDHFDILGTYIDLADFDFEDAKNVLTVKGGRLMPERARQQLFALLLNFASGRIGNSTIISDDGRDAADAVTHVANLLNDSDATNDETAKDICEDINLGIMVPRGLVPDYGMAYKLSYNCSVPEDFNLLQNYPNPFNPATEISFALPFASDVKLQVFNTLGQIVATLHEGHLEAGAHSYTWDGSTVASGVYLYKLTAGGFIETKKMVLLK